MPYIGIFVKLLLPPPEQKETNIEMHPLVFIVITIFVIYLC